MMNLKKLMRIFEFQMLVYNLITQLLRMKFMKTNFIIQSLDNDKQFYGLDELYGSKVDSISSMYEPMPSVSQHAGESSHYKVDWIHVYTQIELQSRN